MPPPVNQIQHPFEVRPDDSGVSRRMDQTMPLWQTGLLLGVELSPWARKDLRAWSFEEHVIEDVARHHRPAVGQGAGPSASDTDPVDPGGACRQPLADRGRDRCAAWKRQLPRPAARGPEADLAREDAAGSR